MFEVKEIPIGNNWLNNLDDFYSWCKREQERLTPKNACAQSCSTMNGTVGFLNKYPNFEVAYQSWKSEWEKQLEGVQNEDQA